MRIRSFNVICAALVIMSVLTLNVCATTVEGRCGDNIEYSLGSDGILKLYGSGRMWDFGHDYHAPWYSKKEQIDTVIIDGVATVGKYAFSGMTALKVVYINSDIDVFSENAFEGCTSIERVETDSLESFCSAEFDSRNANPLHGGAYLCMDGEPLKTIAVPDTVEELYSFTFVNCKNEATVYIPDSVKGIGSLVFDKCDGFTVEAYSGSIAEKYAAENNIPFKAIKESSTGAGEEVTVTLPPFPVEVFWRSYDSGNAEYPMLFYKDITYYPLTYTDSRNAGILADFTTERGLELQKTDMTGSFPTIMSATPNPAEVTANIAAGTITVNGNRMYNKYREYPFLIFRDITYFPLTWHLANTNFGWEYSFDTVNGLTIGR